MNAIRLLARESKAIHKYFALAVFFVGIETLFEVLIPLLMADIIDQGVVNKDMGVFVSRGLGMRRFYVFTFFFER